MINVEEKIQQLIKAEKEREEENKKQNNYTPIILWLFPLLLLNIGWFFLGYIDQHWREQELIDDSKQEVEALSVKSDFNYCFSSLAGRFFEALELEYKTYNAIKPNRIASFSNYYFEAPFPNYSLSVFEIASSTDKASLLFKKNFPYKERLLNNTFEFLVNNNSNISNPSYENETRLLLDNINEVSIIAKTQKSKVTFTSILGKSGLFLWDYYKNPLNSDIIGFFIFIDNDSISESSGRQLAIKDLDKNRNSLDNRKLGAFIPLFPECGGMVYSKDLLQKPEILHLLNSWIPSEIEDLFKWQKTGSPLKSQNIFGQYRAFFHIAPNQTHAAVLFVPVINTELFPIWLIIVNIIVLFIIITLLVRGFAFGLWPQVSLKVRFITTYFLAACLPLGLMIIASYGYISEFKHTTVFKTLSKLKLKISEFDSYKVKSQDEYKTVFIDIQNDSNIVNALKNINNNPIYSGDTFSLESMDYLSKVINALNKDNNNLPVIAFSLINENGECLSNIGNDLCPYYKSLDNKEYFNENLNYAKSKDKEIFRKESNTINKTLLSLLHDKIKTLSITNELNKEVEKNNSDDVLNNVFAEKLEKQNNNIITIYSGSNSYSIIYNYVYVDGRPKFVFCLYWDESGLDERTFISTSREFNVNYPNFVFSGYKVSPQGIKIWPEELNRHSLKINESNIDIIKQAYIRKTVVYDKNEKMSIVAVPSRQYKDLIIVGRALFNTLDLDIFYRFWICVFIIVIALIIFLVCLHYSDKLFLQPIYNLKSLLDKISDGNYDIEIKSNSSDEFGLMCKEFNGMTKDLAERDKLATLLSDHAIEALSKNENDYIEVESFKGTVLVSDIRNFTGMCEEHTPDQINDLLNNHFARMTKIVSSKNGRIYKYIGDAIVVIFADKDDSKISSVERAFLVSFEMLKCLKEINGERISKKLFDYKIGIGLCYGDMSSGAIGSVETRLDYAIVGDVINYASKLESASVNNPDFPLIVDESFLEKINKVYPNIKFEKLNKDINGYKLNSDNIEIINKELQEKLTEINNPDKQSNISDCKENNENANKDENNNNRIYEIEENLTFSQKFIPGFIFVIILAIIMASGIYFVYNTAHDSEKIPLEIANNRDLEQITCKECSKTEFDIKSRSIASKLHRKIEQQDSKLINEDFISISLDEICQSDKSFESINLKRVFIKVNELPEVSNRDISFIDKISLRGISNIGFSDKDLLNISNSFKLIIGIDSLQKISNKLYLSQSDSDAFKQASIKYMNEKYSDPSVEVFGNKLSINRFKEEAKNASVEGIYLGKNCYLYWIDFYKDGKLIGYLLISMFSDEVRNSIPLLLDSYSREGALISLKNKQTGEWYFSNNISDEIKKGVLVSDKNTSVSKEKDIRYIGNDYLYNLLGSTDRRLINIADIPYDIYITRLCKLNRGNPANALFWVFVIITTISVTLWKICNKTSVINSSIEAKLWVALLIIAVIPVINVFFVFGLFRSEYYSVKSNIKRENMQRQCELFEQKKDFTSPLIWNYIRKKNKSEIFTNFGVGNSNDNIRPIVQGWIDERKPWELFGAHIDFKIENVFIYSNKNCKFSLKNNNQLNDDNKDFLRNDFDYIKMFEEISENILNSKTNYFNKGELSAKSFSETNLDFIKRLYGNEIYLKFIHSLDNPIYLRIGDNNYGFLFDINSSGNVISWMVKFNDYKTLSDLSKTIKTDCSIYFASKNKYGQLYKNNNNYYRIPFGEYAGWMSFSNLPISSDLKTDEDTYLIEGKISAADKNTMFLSVMPYKELSNEISLFSLGFYILLGISLLIIIHTTRNIADDMINPINNMMKAIKEIKKENFSYRINSDRKDELGDLCLAFDKMIKGLDEKRMMSKMLSNTAKMVTLKEGDSSSIKTNSVLFYVGIPGFSNIINNLKDNELFEKLSNQTSLIAGIIIEEGGEVDKIIGDKLLAVFPIKDKESIVARAACMAAKRLIELENSNKLPLSISIGINYGNVINGFLGIGNKRDFTVIGDAVNVTARIESLAEKMNNDRCLISESFYKLVDNAFKADEYGDVELKGKAQPMKIYQLR